MSRNSSDRTKAAFGSLLRELRDEASLSQERLAEIAGLNRTYISMLENGKRQPSVDVLLRLSTALEVEASDIIERLVRRLQEK